MTKSEQARADALADAETLRLYLWEQTKERHRIGSRISASGQWNHTTLGQAERHAEAVLQTRPWLGDNGGVSVARWGTLAARAAFRAVPKLRGDK
jgi:hypothetical protein